jgi:5-methylcytosine-specific restriction enzyme subunit McrC
MSTEHIKLFEHTSYKRDTFPDPPKDSWESLGKLLTKLEKSSTITGKKDTSSKFIITDTELRTKQYVGAFQFGKLRIEILPKIDYEREDSEIPKEKYVENGEGQKWHDVLVSMLKECKKLTISQLSHTAEESIKHDLLDLYLLWFIDLCQLLVHQGLLKKYIQVEKNRTALKGKLLFKQQIQHNAVHKERFYTRHAEYSMDNVYNQLLVLALKKLTNTYFSPTIRSKAQQTLFQFPEVSSVNNLHKAFKSIVFDRKSEAYKIPLELAKMILNAESNNLKSGNMPMIGILFDMNKLWEEYLYSILKKAEGVTEIHFNSEKVFWKCDSDSITPTKVKPDIILKVNKATIVLDAKWKIPKDERPSSADLMQLFSYAMITGAEKSYLVFPKKPDKENQSIDKKDGGFKLDGKKYSNVKVQGGYLRVSVLNVEGKALNPNLGNQIITELMGN